MSAYVDALFTARAKGSAAALVGRRNANRWCHLMADTEEELHAMADLIGMRREWFQGDHYDLTPGRRAVAIRSGAIEVDAIFLVNLRRIRRGDKPLFPRGVA